MSNVVACSNNDGAFAQTIMRFIAVASIAAVLSVSLTSLCRAQPFNTLYSFGGGPDGADPRSIILVDGFLYGTAFYGGASSTGISGSGTVFRLNADGSAFSTLYNFTKLDWSTGAGTNTDGSQPQGMVCSGSSLYGIAYGGGDWGNGTVFSLNTNEGAFSMLHTFQGQSGPWAAGTADGAGPADLIIVGDTVFGTAEFGGLGACGTVFSINTDGSGFDVLHTFTFDDGGDPRGLTSAGGVLYGTTYTGGTSDSGVVFSINCDGSGYQTLHNFNGDSDGQGPLGIVVCSNQLYGSAQGGGSGGMGTLFTLRTDGTGFKVIHNFASNDGSFPGLGLILSGSNLIGNALYGGTYGYGTIFSIYTDGTDFNVLHSFAGSDGSTPIDLILAGNTLYGAAFNGGEYDFGTVFSLQLPTVNITALRVSLVAANVSASDLVDDLIVPFPDTNILSLATNALGLGVVADGVTPVLFKITGTPGDYSFVMTNDAADYLNGDFSSNLFTLQTNLFSRQSNFWAQATNFAITSSTNVGVTYAYLQGMDWSNFIVLSPSNEVNVGLSIMPTNSALSLAHIGFKIRPPPVALVHGYKADSTSWAPSFTDVLGETTPNDFIIAVNYGTNDGDWVNSYGTLGDLAILLDSVLSNQVETVLNAQWDFTRYDVVGHSQGGVLLRMLCENLPALSEVPTPRFAQEPVVGPQNSYRGRFRRVITIGSPHNGSLILHYLLQWRIFNPTWVSSLPFGVGQLLQEKFDPFGWQIAQINDPFYQVDPRIKFCCISATINDGQPPTGAYDVPAYVALGLCNLQPGSIMTGGQILLPRGSDGIVDFDSQGGGAGTLGYVIQNSSLYPANIVHADALQWLFGVGQGQSEASDPRVAGVVRSLLDGPSCLFGPFILPTVLSSEEKTLVDSLSYEISANTITANLIYNLPHAFDDTTNYYFQAQIPANVPSGGVFGWNVEVFGTNGMTSDGASISVNTNDSSEVSLAVDESVIGTVVLFVYYDAPNGMVVSGTPQVIFSQLPGGVLGGLSLDPPNATLGRGDSVTLQLWGVYMNGTSALLFATQGSVAYYSSNTNVATVDAFGVVTAQGYGSAEITALYNGLLGQTQVYVSPPSVSAFSALSISNGSVSIALIGGTGVTNVLEASTNLADWTTVYSWYNTNGFFEFVDTNVSNYRARYYRIAFP